MKRLILVSVCLLARAVIFAAPIFTPGKPLAAPAVSQAAVIPGWYQLHTFGSGHWKLGLDAGVTGSACIERELHDGQFLAGPCRDILLLAKDGHVAFHIGAGIMSNTQHGNTSFQGRFGFNIGPAARASLLSAADKIPVLENVASIQLPPWASKIGDAMTVDFAGGYRPTHDSSVNGNWTYGVAVKVDLPLDTAFGWLAKGL